MHKSTTASSFQSGRQDLHIAAEGKSGSQRQGAFIRGVVHEPHSSGPIAEGGIDWAEEKRLQHSGQDYMIARSGKRLAESRSHSEL